MKRNRILGPILAGGYAGMVNGLFGAGGGMVLVPLLTLLTPIEENKLFSTSLWVILPICMISLGYTLLSGPCPWADALPYLAGSAIGGLLAGKFGARIPTLWLHKGLGLLILWGGVRYLC